MAEPKETIIRLPRNVNAMDYDKVVQSILNAAKDAKYKITDKKVIIPNLASVRKRTRDQAKETDENSEQTDAKKRMENS